MRNSPIVKSRFLILGSGFIIILTLVWFFILPELSSVEDKDALPILPSPTGYSAEPDQEGWRPLFNGTNLDGWEITNFGPQGPVYVSDSEIILIYGDGCTGITWKQDFPTVNYEISLEAMRLDGHDFFCGLTFPVNDQNCTLITGGWGGTVTGISSIDGIDASENFTRTFMNFENKRWYKIRVSVDQQMIRCFVDEEPVIQVPVEDHRFSVRSEVGLSRPLGIATWHTTAALRNLRFREIVSP